MIERRLISPQHVERVKCTRKYVLGSSSMLLCCRRSEVKGLAMRMRENATLLERGHSRVGLGLCVKTCLRAKPFIRKCNLVVNKNVFH